MKIEAILGRVMAEIDRAEKLHPVWPADIVKAAAIPAEEAGELLKAANRLLDANALSAAGAAAIVDMLAKFDRIFGCFDVEHAAERVAADESAPADVTALAEARAAARKARDFAESDRLRDAIREKGYVIEDAPGGAWRLKKA